MSGKAITRASAARVDEIGGIIAQPQQAKPRWTAGADSSADGAVTHPGAAGRRRFHLA